jgi:hypothetical protein
MLAGGGDDDDDDDGPELSRCGGQAEKRGARTRRGQRRGRATGRSGGEGEGEVTASTDPRVGNYQVLFTALAAFYLFVAVLMAVMSWIIPNINLGASISFTLIAIIVLIGAAVQIRYRKELVAYICGVCPQQPYPH